MRIITTSDINWVFSNFCLSLNVLQFYSSSDFANATSVTACKSKLVSNVGLEKFKIKSLLPKKLQIFSGENAVKMLLQ